MYHVKMSPNQKLSDAHKYWKDINSRSPVYVLWDNKQTKPLKTTTDKAEAEKHGNYSTYPIDTYYHDEAINLPEFI